MLARCQRFEWPCDRQQPSEVGTGSRHGDRGLISSTTAAAITSALGEAYIATLDTLFARHEGNPHSQQEVVEELRRRLRGG